MTTVLVVDSERGFRGALERGLAQSGFEPVGTHSVRAALDVASETSVAALVTELRLADGHGLELVRDLRSRGVRVPAFAMTALWSRDEEAEALSLGGVERLQKPFEPAELQALLGVHLEPELQPHKWPRTIDVLLQAHHRGESVRLTSEDGRGAVQIVDGAITDVRWEGVSGEAALIVLLTENPRLHRTGAPAHGVRSIDTPFKSLLLQVLRRLEQFERRGGEVRE